MATRRQRAQRDAKVIRREGTAFERRQALQAAADGDLELLELCFALHPTPETLTQLGRLEGGRGPAYTAVHYAAMYGHARAVELLLREGAALAALQPSGEDDEGLGDGEGDGARVALLGLADAVRRCARRPLFDA